jgi:hypothetical protein
MIVLFYCVTANSEMTLKFTAGLATSIGLVAVLDNFCHIDRLRVQVGTFTLDSGEVAL